MESDNKIYPIYIYFFCSIFLFPDILANYYSTVPPPRLECGSDGIRLHMNPTGSFGGHVYVRGFFPQSVCHLNYCTQLTNSPFVMDLPFRGPCNVRRRRNVAPPSISYDVTVIIQHHPLFVTSFDKAYRLNCIYRQREALVQQRLNVSDLPSSQIQSNTTPKCRYDVLAGTLNGPVVRLANVGDVVVHKWSCDGDKYGFLVHSCVVRDESGKDYQFIDERGCVTDQSLFPSLTYSTDLHNAYTTIRAFRYADQVMVHFSCQITTCRKQEQGCEGITPPSCTPVELGPIPVSYAKNKAKQIPSTSTTPVMPTIVTLPTRSSRISTTTVIQTTTRPSSTTSRASVVTSGTIASARKPKIIEDEPNNDLYAFPNVKPLDGTGTDNSADFEIRDKNEGEEYGLEIGRPSHLPARSAASKTLFVAEQEKGFRVETLSQTMDSPLEPLPYPTKASVYQHRLPRSHKGIAEEQNITLEVESSQILILENDNEMENERRFKPQTKAEPQVVKIETTSCKSSDFSVGKTMLLATLAVSQVISIMAIITQRFYYKKSINKLMYVDDRPSTRKY